MRCGESEQKGDVMQQRRLRWLGVMGLFLFAACAKQPELPPCTAPEDNPQHHYVQGMEKLEAENLEDARSKFERALFCDKDYAPAHAGRALVHAMQASRQAESGYQQVDVARALTALKESRRHSETPEERFIYHTTAIRVLTAIQGKKWLSEAEWHLQKSQALNVDEARLPYYQGTEAAPYFM